MAEWADWFIQFPTFTYLRVYGYSGAPLMLPRYPSDEVIFMEFLRQAHGVHTVLRNRKKPSLHFPLGLGIYTCRTAADARTIGEELDKFGLKSYSERRSFDPHGVYTGRLEKNYNHIPALEDFWANCADEFEVRRRSYSRLTLHQMKDCLNEDIKGSLMMMKMCFYQCTLRNESRINLFHKLIGQTKNLF